MEVTYKIIGADGREYGPVNLEELKAWIKDGRVAHFTNVWSSAAEAWMAAGKLPEIAAELSLALPPAIPAITPAQPEVVPTGFWVRLLAYFLDLFVLSLIMTVACLPFKAQLGPMANLTAAKLTEMMNGGDTAAITEFVQASLVYCTIYSFVSLAYFIGMNGRFGATCGKLALGARIVNEDGSKITYRKAFWRYSGEIISFCTLGIGYLMIAFHPQKRGLHDLIAKTRVIYSR